MSLFKTMKQSVPSIITELNLISGVISIILAFNNQVTIACMFVLLAAFFDLFDGLVARLLNAVSDFGKQIDSLADVVSFGVAPSIILYRYINIYVYPFENFNSNYIDCSLTEIALLFLTVSPAVFGSLRLARYNISKSSGNHFQGIPIPASALFVLGLWLFNQAYAISLLSKPIVIAILVMSVCLLMVSNITMLSLKTKGNSTYTNIYLVSFVIGVIVMGIVFKLAALFPVMLFYITLSFLHGIFEKKNF